jgi:hypothetical protein
MLTQRMGRQACLVCVATASCHTLDGLARGRNEVKRMNEKEIDALVEQHWEYTRKIMELMYKEAMKHGIKHGIEIGRRE